MRACVCGGGWGGGGCVYVPACVRVCTRTACVRLCVHMIRVWRVYDMYVYMCLLAHHTQACHWQKSNRSRLHPRVSGVCVRACVRAWVRVCVRASVHVHNSQVLRSTNLLVLVDAIFSLVVTTSLT